MPAAQRHCDDPEGPVTETKEIPASDDRAAFWERVMWLGPPAVLVLALAVPWLLGGFDDFEWINQPVTFIQSLAILGGMCFPLGTFYYARGEWHAARARLSRAWPTVPGVVRSNRVARRATRGPTLYKLALLYGYEVGGRGFEGDTVQFGPKFVSAKDLIDALAIKYPVGAAVTVHYDPDDPATSVLETSDEMARQNRWQIWCFFGAPFVISIVVAIKNAGP